MQKNNTIVIWVVVIVIIIAVAGFWKYRSNQSAMNAEGIPSEVTPGATSPVVPTTPPSTPPTASHALDGNTFRLTSYDSNVIPTNENYIVSFTNGKMSGTICNSFSGPYTTTTTSTTSTITSNFTITLKACTSPKDIMAIEQLFGKTFGQSATYKYAKPMLTITGSGHTLVLNAYSK